MNSAFQTLPARRGFLQDQSTTMFMENTDPSTVTPVIIQLADWDTEVHGCPCELALDSSASTDIINKFLDKKFTKLDPIEVI